MLAGIQQDFGGFDPKFLGVTLRFSAQSPESWELYRQLSVAADDPAQLVAMGNEALKLPEAKAFEVFSLGTVLFHETRHFHDFLLSPYGNRLFRLRLMAAANGTQVMGDLKKAGTKFLPVPLPRWRRKSPAERARIAARWRKIYGVEQRFEEFDLAAGDTTTLAEQTESAYARIADQLKNPRTERAGVSLQPSDLFEASAILAQFQHIYSVFGEPHARLFLQVILNEPSALAYAKVVRLLDDLWKNAGLPLDPAAMSAVVSWTMFGDYEQDRWEACPSERFVKLYGYLVDAGPPAPGTNAGVLFEEWTEALGVRPIARALEGNAASNEKLVVKFDQLFRGNWADVFPDLMEGARCLAKAHKHMAVRLLHNPDGYVRPYEYGEKAHEWVAAPVAVQFTGGAMLVRNDALRGATIHKARVRDAEHLMVMRMNLDEQTPRVRLIDGAIAQGLSDVITMTDFLFAEFNRDDPDFELVRQTLEKAGIFPLELLY